MGLDVGLLEAFSTECVLMEKQRLPDGEGGWLPTSWTEGATFQNFKNQDTSTLSKIAEAQGVTSLYSLLVKKDVPIDIGDYFKDKFTGETFCVTSIPNDKQIPSSASPILSDLKYYTAERRSLPL